MSALEILNPDVVGVVGKALVGDGGGGISTTACSFVCKSLALSADRVRSIILDCGGPAKCILDQKYQSVVAD